jgi:arsenate reductase (glutaredoxin)
MKTKIFHNPRCSKSRIAADYLKENNIDHEIIEYLKDTPTIEELDNICTLLNVEPLELIRKKEKVFSELGLSAKDEKPRSEWLKLMIENPILIERPIVITKDRAAIGRPLENIIDIL